jgi:hypothetical protein
VSSATAGEFRRPPDNNFFVIANNMETYNPDQAIDPLEWTTLDEEHLE